MKKFLTLIAMLALGVTASYAQVESTFVEGATGTTSATVVVKPGTSAAEIRDVGFRVDAGNNSATIDIRTGKSRKNVNSATSGSGTVLWFDNDPTVATTDDFVLFEDASLGTYSLLRVQASATTSITVRETISVATTTSDGVYPLNARVRRPAPVSPSSTVSYVTSIWLPAGVPSALTLDGNTTSCQIAISGVRTNTK